MTQSGDLRGPTFYPANLLASLLVLALMALAYWKFSGPDVPDWIGYSRIFDQEGSWLARQGRDPLFIQLVRWARLAFGPNGYAVFRFGLFGVVSIFAARIAYAMPSKFVSPVFAAALVVAAMALKGLVQIREGLAFVFVAWPMIGVFRGKTGGRLAAGAGALIGALIHIGAGAFVVAWLVAYALYLSPSRVLRGRGVVWALSTLGVSAGAVAAVLIFRFSTAIEFDLQDFGVDTSVQAVGGVQKYIFWSCSGVAVLVAGHQLLSAAQGSRKFGYAYAMVLGAAILPGLYVVCAVLVFSDFYLPAATSLSVRLLLSSMSLSLLIVGLRGKATASTLGIATAVFLYGLRPLILQGP